LFSNQTQFSAFSRPSGYHNPPRAAILFLHIAQDGLGLDSVFYSFKKHLLEDGDAAFLLPLFCGIIRHE
jgi:hypothetical protein